jgi:hypothetical protein
MRSKSKLRKSGANRIAERQGGSRTYSLLAHGLPHAPSPEDFTPTNISGWASATKVCMGTITSTQATVNVDVNSGTTMTSLPHGARALLLNVVCDGSLFVWQSHLALMFNFEQWERLSVYTMMSHDAARELKLWLALSESPPVPAPMAREAPSSSATELRSAEPPD